MMPEICPQCRSTAVLPKGLSVHCYMCGWEGQKEELLTVVSDGLSLEDALDRFAIDLTHVLSANVSTPLRDFLLRWGIVKEEDTDVMKFLLGMSVQAFATSVMNYLLRVGEAAAKEHGEEEPESATGPVDFGGGDK